MMKRTLFYGMRVAVCLFLCAFILGNTYQNTISIISPKEKEEVGKRVIVKGTSTIKDESHVWVFVHATIFPDQWWPQPPVLIDQKGNWQVAAYIGEFENIGLDFEIAAFTLDKNAEAPIIKYFEQGNTTGAWRPIAFPETVTSEVVKVTVKKVSH